MSGTWAQGFAPTEASAGDNGRMITLVKVLQNILYAAGYLAIAVLAYVTSYYGKPELGRHSVARKIPLW